MNSTALATEGLVAFCPPLCDEAHLLDYLLRGAADGVLVIDEDQRIVCWNRAASSILGFDAEEARGRRCYELLDGVSQDCGLVCAPDCSILREGARGFGTPGLDLLLRTASGRRRLVSFTTLVSPVPAPGKRPIAHIFHPLRQQERMEAFLRRFMMEAQELVSNHSRMAVRGVLEDPSRIGLTEREREVLGLLARGQKVPQIAATLSLSPTTVRWYSQRILNKLGVHSRLEAVAFVREHGLDLYLTSNRAGDGPEAR